MNKGLTKAASIISVVLSALVVLAVVGIACFYIVPEIWAMDLFAIFRGEYRLFGITFAVIGFILVIFAAALILVAALIVGIGLILSIITLVVCNKDPETYARRKKGILTVIIIFGVWATLALAAVIIVLSQGFGSDYPWLWSLISLPIIFEICFAMLLIDYIRNKKVLPKFLEKKATTTKKEVEAYAASPWAKKQEANAETVVIEEESKPSPALPEKPTNSDPDLTKKKKSKK